MRNYLLNHPIFFEKVNFNKKTCLIVSDGRKHLEMLDENILELIDLLKNTLKNNEKLNKVISEINEEQYLQEIIEWNKPIIKEKKIRSGFVYIAKCNHTGLYKIGSTTREPNKRIQELKITNPSIEKHLSFSTKDIKDEIEFHKIFADKKISGEWFKLDNLDLEIIIKFYNK